MGVAYKRATVYLEPDLHQALQTRAAATDQTVSELIKDVIREDFEQEEEDLILIQERADERGIPFQEAVRDLKLRGKI